VLAYMSGHSYFASYLQLVPVSQGAELTIFCGAMTGASLGFLWWNAHPADVFMGDVGSLALGGGLGTVAVLIKQEILLFFIGGVYVMELLAVVLQVLSMRLRGRRLFLRSPLHHHFEELGWEEAKIITRFWIMGLVMALFALTTLKLR
jgi:phospho-N-acetylmuramoyl-pentapeptide-transferase